MVVKGSTDKVRLDKLHHVLLDEAFQLQFGPVSGIFYMMDLSY